MNVKLIDAPIIDATQDVIVSAKYQHSQSFLKFIR
ncbi:hypothetical protein BH09BAC6_BH09BAC6_16880 [soil metagenome]